MRIASSSASCASCCSSAMFSFSTLILSRQETGSPSGVSQMVSCSLIGGSLCLGAVVVAFLLRSGLGEEVLADEVLEADRRLRLLDPAAGLDHIVGAARDERHVLVAENPARR